MYYFITIFKDKGITEVFKIEKIDRHLISLYEYCIGSNNNISLLLSGQLLEWEDKMNNLTFIEVNDLIERFEYLKSTDSADEYQELKEYILKNYKKGEE